MKQQTYCKYDVANYLTNNREQVLGSIKRLIYWIPATVIEKPVLAYWDDEIQIEARQMQYKHRDMDLRAREVPWQSLLQKKNVDHD